MNIIVAIVILGLVIFIHELGHFLLAKKNGITVTEFSLGMGPRIASVEKNGTKYSLKLLPFGGSCMMLGEDETVEDEGAFQKKSVWARFSVIFAGAFFNFILAFILALIVIGSGGIDLPKAWVVEEGSKAYEAGLREGDTIHEINGTNINIGREAALYFYFNPVDSETIKVEYERDGKKYTANIMPEEIHRPMLGFHYTPSDEPAEIGLLVENGVMANAGIKTGDIITAFDGNKIESGKALSDYISKNPLSEDKEIAVTYERNGKEHVVNLKPKFVTEYKMGWNYEVFFNEKISPLKVIKYSLYELKYNIATTLKSLVALVTNKVSVKEVAGPVRVVNYVDELVDETKEYGFRVTFLTLANFVILISANLGVMNLLPLPALDGGRLVFLVIEAVRGKPVPKEKEAMVHVVGMALLMLFSIFVLFNDIMFIFK